MINVLRGRPLQRPKLFRNPNLCILHDNGLEFDNTHQLPEAHTHLSFLNTLSISHQPSCPPEIPHAGRPKPGITKRMLSLHIKDMEAQVVSKYHLRCYHTDGLKDGFLRAPLSAVHALYITSPIIR